MSIYAAEFIKIINILRPQIRQKIDVLKHDFKSLKVSKKADNTIVTDFDIFISDLFKAELKLKFPEINFYSEEDQGVFDFPICIIDPIDGTREFAKGINECAVSVGLYFSDQIDDERNISWIYNPITEFEVSSFDELPICKIQSDKIKAFVSNTEFESGMHLSHDNISYGPKGSIAFKLGLLAANGCDFVITKKDKNIWDILAGTHICLKNGIRLYHHDKVINNISKELYKAPLVWVNDEIRSKVDFKFEISKK
jgi:myo-inositol-1(or 4)-monophosphatase